MAINPPSDLVLDVAMAANPETMRASADKLRSMMSERLTAQVHLSRDNFAAIQGMTQPTNAETMAKQVDKPNPAFKKFEAFMLQSFVESMFEGDNQAVFGQGIAGDYWKSMMAESVANKMADAGGIGIAHMLEQQSGKKAKNATADVPGTSPTTLNDQGHLQKQDSNVILHQIKR